MGGKSGGAVEDFGGGDGGYGSRKKVYDDIRKRARANQAHDMRGALPDFNKTPEGMDGTNVSQAEADLNESFNTGGSAAPVKPDFNKTPEGMDGTNVSQTDVNLDADFRLGGKSDPRVAPAPAEGEITAEDIRAALEALNAVASDPVEVAAVRPGNDIDPEPAAPPAPEDDEELLRLALEA